MIWGIFSVSPTPGFEAMYAVIGLLAVAYLIRRHEN